MIPFYKPNVSRSSRLESTLLKLAVVFLFILALEITIAPAVRLRSWDVSFRWQHWIGWLIWYVSFAIFYWVLNHKIPEHDPYILPIAAVLSGWGLLTVWRLNESYGLRQSVWLATGLLACLIILQKKDVLAFLQRYKYFWLICGLSLTALTFIVGTYPSGEGPHLWLSWAGLFIQPSEPLKLLLIIYLAAYLADQQFSTTQNLLRSVLPTVILISIAFVMLVAQRDLGTASIFILIYFTVLYFSTGKRRVLLLGAFLAGGAALIGYQLFEIIRSRMDSWINPWLDPSGKSYQIVQSIIAVAAGGLFGRGVGLGSPGLIPVAQSDYIFSAIIEETGLVGALALISLYCLFAGRGLQIALRSTTLYKRYLSAGITAYFIIQTCIIAGGNLRIFPLTGVTLPLVSYGGSSLLTSLLACLLLLLISSDSDEEPYPLTSPRPFLFIGSAMLGMLLIVSLSIGYWAIIQADTLVNRTDNARRSIDDYYVQRGTIKDRNHIALVTTTGEPGEYQRQVVYPLLGPVIGYTNLTYGQAGLEASLDGYLRGISANSGLDVWINHILYGQPPAGSDIVLNIDLNLQKTADTLLGNHHGAVVLMNAESGGVLVMASHPSFDPNQLEQNWEKWIDDPDYPLVNRATQINYPVNSVLGPALYTEAMEQKKLPELPSSLVEKIAVDGGSLKWECTSNKPITLWPEAISNGCPGAVDALYRSMDISSIKYLLSKIGLDQAPSIPVPVAPAENDLLGVKDGADIQNMSIKATPLQMAAFASTISAKGQLPSPRLTLSLELKDGKKVAFTSALPTSAFSSETAQRTAYTLSINNFPIWKTSARVYQNGGFFAWFIGGTTSNWQGSPLAVAVLLEEDNPALAEEIGISLLETIVKPPSQQE